MAFGIGTNTRTAGSGFPRGKQKEIACQCMPECVLWSLTAS